MPEKSYKHDSTNLNRQGKTDSSQNVFGDAIILLPSFLDFIHPLFFYKALTNLKTLKSH
jgi:hypothetical protein